MPTLSELYGHNPLAASASITRSIPKRKPAPVVEEPEVEELEHEEPEQPHQGILSKVGNTALGGLAMLGNALDLPGSSVRDVLNLKNPFDQYLTPFSDSNRTSGRELLRNYGLIGNKDTYGNFFGGMAAEIATDPTSFIAPFALTKAGTAAKKANLLKNAKQAVNSAAKKQASTAVEEAAKQGTKAFKAVPKEIGSLGARLRATPRTLINEASDPMQALEDFYNGGGTKEMLDSPVQSLAHFSIPLLKWIPGLSDTAIAKAEKFWTVNPVKYSDDLPDPSKAAAKAVEPEVQQAAQAVAKQVADEVDPIESAAVETAAVEPQKVEPANKPAPATKLPAPINPKPTTATEVKGAEVDGTLYTGDELRSKIGLDPQSSDLTSFVTDDVISMVTEAKGGKATAQDILNALDEVGPENGLDDEELAVIKQVIINNTSSNPAPAVKLPEPINKPTSTPVATAQEPTPKVETQLPPPINRPAELPPPIAKTVEAPVATAQESVPETIPTPSPNKLPPPINATVEPPKTEPPVKAEPTVEPTPTPSPTVVPDKPLSLNDRILASVAGDGLNTKEIARALKMQPAAIASEIMKLNEAGQLTLNKRGNWVSTVATANKKRSNDPFDGFTPFAKVFTKEQNPGKKIKQLTDEHRDDAIDFIQGKADEFIQGGGYNAPSTGNGANDLVKANAFRNYIQSIGHEVGELRTADNGVSFEIKTKGTPTASVATETPLPKPLNQLPPSPLVSTAINDTVATAGKASDQLPPPINTKGPSVVDADDQDLFEGIAQNLAENARRHSELTKKAGKAPTPEDASELARLEEEIIQNVGTIGDLDASSIGSIRAALKKNPDILVSAGATAAEQKHLQEFTDAILGKKAKAKELPPAINSQPAADAPAATIDLPEGDVGKSYKTERGASNFAKAATEKLADAERGSFTHEAVKMADDTWRVVKKALQPAAAVSHIVRSVDGNVDYKATSEAFSAISPKHAAYNTRLEQFKSDGLLSDPDAAFVQSMLADADMSLVPEFQVRRVSSPGVHGTATRITSADDPNYLDYAMALDDSSNLPEGLSQAGVVLHETGHLIFHELERTDPELFNAATSYIQRVIDDGTIEKHFGKIETAQEIIEHLSDDPHEVFAQFFAYTSAKGANKLPTPIVSLMKKAWSKLIDYAKKIIKVGDKADPRVRTIEKLARYGAGFMDAPQREEMIKLVSSFKTSADWSNEMAELKNIKPGTLKQMFGADPTPEQLAQHAEWTKDWHSKYNLAAASHKTALASEKAALATEKAERETHYMRGLINLSNGYSTTIRGAYNAWGAVDGARQKVAESAKSWLGKLKEDWATPLADALDKGGDLLLAIPGINHLEALFNTRTYGASTKIGRAIGGERFEQIQEAINNMRETINPLVEQLHSSKLFDIASVMQEQGGTIEEATNEVNKRASSLRRYLEGIDDKPFKDIEALEGVAPIVRQMMDSIIKLEKESGLNVRYLLDDDAWYVPRSKRSPNKAFSYSPYVGPVFDVTHDAMRKREDFLRNLPGGTAVVNDMSLDENLSGIVHSNPVIKEKLETGDVKDLRQYVADKYGPQLDASFDDPDFVFDAEKDKRFDQMIQFLAGLDPGHVNEQMPVFGRNVLQDISERMENGFRASYLAKAAQELIGKSLKKRGTATTKSQVVVHEKLLKEIELLSPRSLDNIVGHMDKSVISSRDKAIAFQMDELRNKAATAAPGETIYKTSSNGRRQELRIGEDENLYLVEWEKTRFDADGNPLKKEKLNEVQTLFDIDEEEALDQLVRSEINSDVLSQYGVPTEVYNDAIRWLKPYSQPEEVNAVQNGLRRFLNIFRANQTAPFPAFHVRNLISGQLQNAFFGAVDPDAKSPWMKVYKPIADAYTMRNGQAIEGIAGKIKGFEKLTDEQATEKLAKEIFANGLIGSKQGLAAEMIGDDISKLASQMPGLNSEVNPLVGKFSPAPAGRTWMDFLNPLAVNGGFSLTNKAPFVQQVTEDLFAGAHYGRDIASFVEDLNRIAPYIALRKQGYNAKAAAEMVNKVQIDYSRLSNFERKTMRMLFPFYTFSSRVLPLTLENLVQHPGGLQAQTIKEVNRFRDPKSMAPDYITQSANIPLGKLSDGSDRYITGLGLAFEDPAKFLPLVGGNSPDGMREAISRMNPLIKGPIEWATERSTFMDGPEGGRPLSDMDPTLGRIGTNLYDLATGERTQRAKPFIGPGFEFVMQNSPLARMGTTVRQLTDPRKWENPLAAALDLGSGIKIADVSPAAQDSIAMQRAAKLFKDFGGREQRIPFIPKDEVEKLTPEQRQDIKELDDLKKSVAKRRKLRQQQAEAEKEGGES